MPITKAVQTSGHVGQRLLRLTRTSHEKRGPSPTGSRITAIRQVGLGETSAQGS